MRGFGLLGVFFAKRTKQKSDNPANRCAARLWSVHLFYQHMTARRKRHIACDEFFHFIAKLIARSFCCSSLPNQTRLRWALVWVRRKAAAFSYRKEISILTVPSKNPECVRDFYLFPLHDSFFLISSLSTGFLEEGGK